VTPENNIGNFSLVESLSKVEGFLGRLQQLPPKNEFVDSVENGFWEAVTKQENPPSVVKYVELPDISHTVIGTFEEDGMQIDPWWLCEFDWKAEFGGEEITLRGDALQSFSDNFDRDRTVLKKPTFRENRYGTDDCSLLVVYDALLSIREELENHIDGDSSREFPDLPHDKFAVKEGRVVVSNSFDDWIESLLQLFPAIGSEATALYLANTGTPRSAAESALEPELFSQIDRLGIVQDKRYNRTYVNEFEKILDNSRVFNRIIPTDDQLTDLSGLKYQLYRGFLETFEPAEEYTSGLFERATRRTPPKLEDGELGVFSRVACGSPLILANSRRPQLMTVPIYSVNTSGKSGYQSGEYRQIKMLFERYGWFQNA